MQCNQLQGVHVGQTKLDAAGWILELGTRLEASFVGAKGSNIEHIPNRIMMGDMISTAQLVVLKKVG